MKNYLYKQFFRNQAYIVALVILLLAGIMSIYTGKKFLDRNEEIISKSSAYQKQSFEKNIKHHHDDLGLLLYYIKHNFVNETPRLAALNIGMRDLNPSIQSVTIRNLEEQRYNSDFYNPTNAAEGNLDFSFVLVFLFPLVILAFCYNLISEEEERGTWKLLSVQSGNLGNFLDAKMSVRLIAISAVYIILILIATIWIRIPLNIAYIIFFVSGWLYIVFWFALSRWIISFRKSSARNALTLLTVWAIINFVVPMGSNMLIQKIYPVHDALKAFMQQREGYHHKWDEPKKPTMERFYKIYPQYQSFKVDESESSNWVWYYAMQQLGDVEASASSRSYTEKMEKRNSAADYLGFIFPNIHTQMVGSQLAKTDMGNQLRYASELQRFHEKKRLYFYPLIFSGKNASTVDWNSQTVSFYRDSEPVVLIKVFLPYFILIGLFIILSQNKYRKLC